MVFNEENIVKVLVSAKIEFSCRCSKAKISKKNARVLAEELLANFSSSFTSTQPDMNIGRLADAISKPRPNDPKEKKDRGIKVMTGEDSVKGDEHYKTFQSNRKAG